MDIILIAGLWLDASVWADVDRALARHGHRGVAVALPGQGDGNTSATLADQLAAVVAAIDEADPNPLVVGHSAACTLAWLAVDARPDAVSKVALIGGFPEAEGGRYADFFEPVDGQMSFPGWEPFEGPDSADLDDATKRLIAESMIPVPVGVSRAEVHYQGETPAPPTLLVCPEFTPEQAREWIAAGDAPALAGADLDYVDLDSGHWPMFTRPDKLAAILADAAGA